MDSRETAAASTERFAAAAMLDFGTALLVSAGLSRDRAGIVAEILLEGDLLGHTTHGFALLPAYLKALAEDSMSRTGEPNVVLDHGTTLSWDGNYLPGPWLTRRAIDIARSRVADNPIVTVTIARSHHIGCLQAYLKSVTDAGLMILLTCSDPANRTVAPFGGVAPRMSPNPIAVGIPTRGEPILIDMSASSTANGVCSRLAAANDRLPGNWLVDAAGNPSDDPRILFNSTGGSILPLGGLDLGYKGFALALIVEALTNGLGGHGRREGINRWGASVFLQIMDPARFSGSAFYDEMEFLAESCRNTPVPAGKNPVRLPGHAALARRAFQLANGIEFHPTVLPGLRPWAEKLGVSFPRAA